MKKRFCALLLAVMVTASFAAGCSNADSSSDTSKGGNTSQTEKSSDTETDTSNEENSSAGNDKSDTATISDTQFKSVFQSGDKVIYNNGNCLYDVTDTAAPSFVEEKTEADNNSTDLPECVSLDQGKSVISGNEAFSFNHKDSESLSYYDLTDSSKVKMTKIDYADALEKAIKSKLGQDASSETLEALRYSADCMMSWCDGGDGSIYFLYVCPPENFNSYPELNYLLGKMSKDGKNIEFIGDDLNACSLAVKDGYIYYADNGYKYTGQTDTALDKDKIGIYKVKTDGSGKEKLVSVNPSADTDQSLSAISSIINRVEIIGDNLYYMAQDGSKETYLYRLPLGGGTPEKVTNDSICDYYIDTASNTLYFWDGSMNSSSPDGHTLFSQPVSGGEKKPLFCKLSARTGLGISVYGDYLYITDVNKFSGYNLVDKNKAADDHDACGQRYDLKTGKLEYLDCYAEVTYSVDELDIQKVESVGAMNISWNEYKDQPENELGVKIYQ